jgi:fructan beta-fructosidase
MDGKLKKKYNTMKQLTFLLRLFLIGICLCKNLQAQYNEKYRPLYHLSAKSSSMADPKGLFIYDGQYHIFWYGQWEHAVSNDLIHWKELPKPMKGAPSQFSYFTGSVVVDKENTSGFGQNSIIAVYTRHFPGDSLPETQAISVSHDGGNEFYYYDGNPVLDINKKSFRDPQVFWHEPSKKWKMVVALSDQHQIPIYESTDLKQWHYCSTFGPIGASSASWECPDLVELPVMGTREKKWVMIIGRGPNKVQYFVGNFDGQKFIVDQEQRDFLRNGKGLNGLVFDDFEELAYSKWQIYGDAFLDLTGSIIAKDFIGNRYAGDLQKKSATGTMKSRSFTISRQAINFLVAGGQEPDSVRVQLVVDGKVVRITAGDNTRVFKWSGWDVHDLIGKRANIEIVDLCTTGQNESIAVDHILFSDRLFALNTEHAMWLDYGDDFYATRTYRNYDPKKNMGDSVILLSWLGNWKYHRIAPTSWGVGMESVPRTIGLKKFPEGLRIVQEPINALKVLRENLSEFSHREIQGIEDINEFRPLKNSYELEIVFDVKTSAYFGVNLLVGEGRKLVLRYDPRTSLLSLDRTNCTDYQSNEDFTKRFATKMYAPVELENSKLKLHIMVDQSSVEVFTGVGKVVVSAVTYPSTTQTGIQLFCERGQITVDSFKAWALKSIW